MLRYGNPPVGRLRIRRMEDGSIFTWINAPMICRASKEIKRKPCRSLLNRTYIRLSDVLLQTKYNDLIQGLVAGANMIAPILAIIALVAVVAILLGGITPVAITITARHGSAIISISITIITVMGAIVTAGECKQIINYIF